MVIRTKAYPRFHSSHQLAGDVRLHGHYGGLRLLRATITACLRRPDIGLASRTLLEELLDR